MYALPCHADCAFLNIAVSFWMWECFNICSLKINILDFVIKESKMFTDFFWGVVMLRYLHMLHVCLWIYVRIFWKAFIKQLCFLVSLVTCSDLRCFNLFCLFEPLFCYIWVTRCLWFSPCDIAQPEDVDVEDSRTKKPRHFDLWSFQQSLVTRGHQSSFSSWSCCALLEVKQFWIAV